MCEMFVVGGCGSWCKVYLSFGVSVLVEFFVYVDGWDSYY